MSVVDLLLDESRFPRLSLNLKKAYAARFRDLEFGGRVRLPLNDDFEPPPRLKRKLVKPKRDPKIVY